MLEAREAGKIGHIGITLHGLEQFETALELPWVETIMFPYNLPIRKMLQNAQSVFGK